MTDRAQHTANLDSLCINTIRTLAIDAIQRANSGHPGAPMGCAPMAYALWTRHLRHDPHAPDWIDRDRFVLSNGHASMLLYSLLHLSGYELSLDDIKNFRQWESKTPGHPENHLTAGVETTTGPLGQGFANAVGFAIAEAQLAAKYNREGHQVIDHFTYAIAGDGCLMEGVAAEAASLAGHLGLGKLVVLYDDNSITIDGNTSVAFTEDVERRFRAYGWHCQTVEDGNDLDAIDAAIVAAKEEGSRPSLIAVKTHIGYGSPNMQDTSKVHGSPLGAAEIKLTKEAYGWPAEEDFLVPEEVKLHFADQILQRAAAAKTWGEKWEAYGEAYGAEASELERRFGGELPEGWRDHLPKFATDAKGMATRASSGKVIQALAEVLPELIGGSADLAASNVTLMKDKTRFAAESPEGRNIYFGVREHAMGAICNGLALHGGFIPFGATFLVFSDYMRGAVRLGALEQAKAIWVWTHDSIGLGEDGPTHQPIEHLAALRAIPNFLMMRPADANEVAEAWAFAIESDRPVGLALTRQGVPTLDREAMAPASMIAKGGYVLADSEAPKAIIMASGSEVMLALEAHASLAAAGIPTRVVNMACFKLFDEQDKDYRDAVLPPNLRARVAVEAGTSLGWYRYVGLDGEVIGLDHFGASAPAATLYEKFGLTAEAIVERIKALV